MSKLIAIALIIVAGSAISPDQRTGVEARALNTVAETTTTTATTTNTRNQQQPSASQNQIKFRRLPPKEFSAQLGSSITIECEAGSSPPPTIHWLKNGQRIEQTEPAADENQVEEQQQQQLSNLVEGAGGKISLSSTRSRLFIDCAGPLDEATYTCVAENPFSRVASHTKLNLVQPELALDGGQREQEEAGKLVAVPQCLGQQNQLQPQPVRIHMWTHNIVEVQKSDLVLYCRSNAGSRQQQQQQQQAKQQAPADETQLQSQQQQQPSSTDLASDADKTRALVTWTLPNDKQVSAELRDKYEILDSGDLLIRDLRWSDMGSYVCTVSDEFTSDSISSFVYPAAVKGKSKRGSLINRFY